MKKCIAYLPLAMVLCGTPPMTQAQVLSQPGLPVPQIIGFPDQVLTSLTDADCRGCHENQDDGALADMGVRHHLLVGKMMSVNSKAPYPNAGQDGTYRCSTCHWQVTVPGGENILEIIQDCTHCHGQSGGGAHHRVDRTLNGECQACHGTIIENPYPPGMDPPWMPTYPVSAITPHQKSCKFCHNPGTATVPGIPDNSGPAYYVASPLDTHHETGFGSDPERCGWCHYYTDEPELNQVRRCGNCHSIGTLHGIQAFPEGGSIETSKEKGWGHIGSFEDCRGCHGSFMASAVEPFTSTMFPKLGSVDSFYVREGSGSRIIIRGHSFKEIFQCRCSVELEAMDGTKHLIPSRTLGDNSILAQIPRELKAGNYRVRVKRGSSTSNSGNLSVIPDAKISSWSTSLPGKLAIFGKNFGERHEGSDAYLHVLVNDRPAATLLWSDSVIIVETPPAAAVQKVKVNTLFGGASLHARSPKPDKKGLALP